MDNTQNPDNGKDGKSIGLVCTFCIIVGFAGVALAFVAAFGRDDFMGAGMCLLASALSFGMLATAVLRN